MTTNPTTNQTTNPATNPATKAASTKPTTYTSMIGDWQRLLAALEAHVAEVPQLEPFRAKLSTLLGQALDASSQQADMRASKQAASKQLRQLAGSGRKVAAVVRLALKEHYGPSDEKLAAFNLKPFRGRVRKPATAPTPAPSPEVTPAPGSASHPTA